MKRGFFTTAVNVSLTLTVSRMVIVVLVLIRGTVNVYAPGNALLKVGITVLD